jgi:hypothetical protein
MRSLRPINFVLLAVLAFLGFSLINSSAEDVSSDVEILTNDYSNHQPSHYLHHKRTSSLIASSASVIPKGKILAADYRHEPRETAQD